MNKSSAASLRSDTQGGATSSPPSREDLPGALEARVINIERMVRAIYEAFFGQEDQGTPDVANHLRPFNETEYRKALTAAGGGNFKAIRSYLKKYQGRREA